MLERLTNPYKDDESFPPLTKLQVDVSVEDWNKVFLAYPYRGAQDKILSRLFQKFAEEVSKSLEPVPSQDNEFKILKTINQLTFIP